MFEIENKFKFANVPRTIRFTEELFEELHELSDKNDISFNLLVLKCCRYAIDNLTDEENNKE